MAASDADAASADNAIPLGLELKMSGFLAAVWLFGALFRGPLAASPLLGHVSAGLLLGPALAGAAPFPAALKLLGKLGVLLLVVESGMVVDLAEVRRVGARAFMAAAAGVIVPVLLTLGILSGLYGEAWQTGLAGGAALAPTSLGFSAKLLADAGLMATPMGQLICTTAVVDDVLSLMLLAEVQALGGGGSLDAWTIVSPIVASIGSIVVGLALTVLMEKPLRAAIESERFARLDKQTGDRALLLAVLVVSAVLALLCRAVGSSDLLGAFLGGLMFSAVPRANEVWGRQCKRLTAWGASLFFACTVAFEVPPIADEATGLFSGPVVATGALLSIAAIAGKFALAAFAQPLTWRDAARFAWAMNGRGEFSFLIAAQAAAEGILSPANTSAVVWALLVSSFAAPFGFRHYLQRDEAAEPAMVAAGEELDGGDELEVVAGGDEHAVAPEEPAAVADGDEHVDPVVLAVEGADAPVDPEGPSAGDGAAEGDEIDGRA